MFVQRRLTQILCQPAIATPVERHRTASVRDDKFQRWKILEQIAEINCMNTVVSPAM